MNRRRLLATLGAVPTIAIAGCTSSTDADEAEGDDTDDESDDDSTDDTTEGDSEPSLDDFEFPEHASRTEIDAVTFADAHIETIYDTGSATVSSSRGREFERHSDEEQTESRISTDGVHATRDTDRYEEQVWTLHGESSGLFRREGGFREEYQITSDAPSTSDFLEERTIEQFVSGFEFGEATAVVDVDGTLTAQYDVTSIADSNALERLVHSESVDEATGSLFITEDGIVRRFRYDIEYQFPQESGRETAEITYHGVGDTTATEPNWANTARSEGRQFTPSKTDDGYLELEFVNGAPIPAGSDVSVNIRAGNDHLRLPEELTVGDRIVVAVDGESLSAAINETPASSSNIDARYAHLSIRNDGFPIYEGSIPL
ncbi:DUF7537 family lipoprotein [Natronorubrum sulfidifaciens]|uniref:Uncharacterized protein n=1 Tax=Natronorubrum sulfidifaciens JCM 14089 TaxID=1230460 RepID=L9VZ51_9EURY|nr:hypothetical protein [Natronorubrum sulfidifaciens]ELY42459.1 hypothetical protein C495_15682 [Natronorubrum sulfidifaciens JCM 14089]